MGKKIIVSLVLITMAVSTPVFSQGGWNYKPGTDYYHLGAKGGISVSNGEIRPLVELSVARQWRNSTFEVATDIYAIIDKKTAIPGVDLNVGYRFSNEHAYFKPSLLAGLDGAQHVVIAENAAYDDTTRQVQIRPSLGAKVEGGLVFGRFELSVELAYRYLFNMDKGKTEVDGMTVTDEYWVRNNFSAMLGLSYNIGTEKSNYDGDHGFQLGVGYGIGKKQNLATVEARFYDRLTYHSTLLWGIEAGMTNGGEIKASTVTANLGYQFNIFDNWHADSWLSLTAVLKGGLGEGWHNADASAVNPQANNSPWDGHTNNVQPGLEVGGFLGVSVLPLKAFRVKNTKGEIEIFAGYELRNTFCFGTKWGGVDLLEITEGENAFGYFKFGAYYTF